MIGDVGDEEWKAWLYRFEDGEWSREPELITEGHSIEDSGWVSLHDFGGDTSTSSLSFTLYVRSNREPGLTVAIYEPHVFGVMEYWQFASWHAAADVLAKWTPIMRDISLMEEFAPSRGFTPFDAGNALERLAARWEWGRTTGLSEQEKNHRRRSARAKGSPGRS